MLYDLMMTELQLRYNVDLNAEDQALHLVINGKHYAMSAPSNLDLLETVDLFHAADEWIQECIILASRKHQNRMGSLYCTDIRAGIRRKIKEEFGSDVEVEFKIYDDIIESTYVSIGKDRIHVDANWCYDLDEVPYMYKVIKAATIKLILYRRMNTSTAPWELEFSYHDREWPEDER